MKAICIVMAFVALAMPFPFNQKLHGDSLPGVDESIPSSGQESTTGVKNRLKVITMGIPTTSTEEGTHSERGSVSDLAMQTTLTNNEEGASTVTVENETEAEAKEEQEKVDQAEEEEE